jgi:hypothetical protein
MFGYNYSYPGGSMRSIHSKVLITVAVFAVLLSSGSAFGFDGLRKGFVLGGGLGFSPVSKWETDLPFGLTELLGTEESKAGVGVNILIGYAWDEFNMIVYEGNITGYDSDLFNQTMTQGFNGAAWYHYFGPMGKSAFTTLGLGLYTFDWENADAADVGVGVMAGGGYEFSRHWQVGGYLGIGRTELAVVDFNHVHVNILVSAVAF